MTTLRPSTEPRTKPGPASRFAPIIARFAPWLASSRRGLAVVAIVLAGSACAATPKQVENVARTDLGCAQISVAEIAKNRYAASGCGRGGVYAQLCGGSPEACTWVRLRGAEQPQASTSGSSASAPTREIIQAPPPAPREIIQAPPPAPREIMQAPPAAPPAPSAPSSAAPPPPDPNVQQAYGAQQVPLSQGDLSQPYQAQVPLQPTAQQVAYPPPAPLEEQQPPPPAPSYQWVGGYWSWGNGNNWLWAPGYWTAPMYGYSYVPGSWYWANNYWWYGPGGWARPNSTYISFGVGARPYRQVYTRSFTPHYTATAYPSRMGAGPAHPNYGTHAPGAGFTPQGSPLYRYPTSGANPLHSERMGVTQAAPSSHSFGGTNYGGFAGPQQPSTFRMGSSPFNAPATQMRSAPLERMPSSSPSFNNPAPSRAPLGRFNGGGGGGAPARMGGGAMHVGPRR